MTRRRFRYLPGLLPPLLALAPLAAPPPAAAQDGAAVFDSAYADWDAGDYVAALERLDRLLAGPDGRALLDDVAVLTGERYRTVEVAPDGTAPRWSPDGRHAAYEVPGDRPRTVVVAIEDGVVRRVAELEGRMAVFSPDGTRIAWLRADDPDALAREEAEIRDRIQVRSRADRTRLRAALDSARAERAVVWVRDLASGAARELPSSSAVRAVVWSEGEAVAFVSGSDVQMSPTGTHLLFQSDNGLALLNTGTSYQRVFPRAASPSFSADGSTLVFIRPDDGGNHLLRVRLGGPGADVGFPEVVFTTTDAIANPAPSADGSMVAFQRMGRENYEVWIVGADGGEPRRLTEDVQHDLFPAFLAGDRLLVIKGEGRHRRSYVYPARAGGDPAVREWVPGLGEGMRLFHNNTVRTVAPEYEWAVSPDGTMVLIGAERDGDTISPERGIYLTDLGRPVTLEEVRARVRAQFAAERDLRERGRRTFEPVAGAVRAAVDDVSVSRIYRYEADLFRFGSKFITQPGNALAIEYLTDRLREFGYEPELQWLPSATSASLRFEPRPGLRSANVIARIPGTVHPDVVYVVSSHFDSVERGPGADDNTSGTTALLEAARVLADRPQAATIEFAFFTGEEAGLLGSREFARRAVEEGKNVVGALNNDMIGYANDHRLDNTIRYSNAGIRDLQHAAAFLFTDLTLHDAHYYKSTDAHALYDAFGDVIGGIGSYPILANPHYHQEHDVLETINHRLVAEVSKATVASIMRMAAGPSRVNGLEARRDGDAVELTWSPAVERNVARWVVVYGPDHDPFRHRVEAREPGARITDAEPGSRFGVKAVTETGLAGWDWAWARESGRRAGVDASSASEVSPSAGGIRDEGVWLTWLSVTNWLLQTGDTRILLDGYLTRVDRRLVEADGSSLGSARTDTVELRRLLAPALPELRLDRILVGHGHGDHAFDVPALARLTGARVTGARTVCHQATALGVPAGACEPVEGGEVLEVGPDVRVRVVRWHHSGDPATEAGRRLGTPLELRGPPPLDRTGGLRPGFLEDYPNGGGSRAYLITVRTAGRPITLFWSNTGNPHAWDVPVPVDTALLRAAGVDLSNLEPAPAPLSARHALAAALEAEGLEGVDYWIGFPGLDHVRQVVGTLRPRAFVPHHWDDFWSPMDDGPGERFENARLEGFLTSSGVRLIVPESYYQRFRLTH